MNSIKLFNKNYAMQNLKKSKGILAIMFIIIPIITLFFLYSYDNQSYSTPYNMPVILTCNYIGMIIIPFILSNVLLGYVYKRNSIDFINSMPISRKKIYLTNILTGIVYIIALQLFNFIIGSIYVLIVKNSLISVAMLADALILMIISYCFIFTISSLALTVSGNKFTQIVVAMLILCLIPFIRCINFSSSFNRGDLRFFNINDKQIECYTENDMLYVTPINILINGSVNGHLFSVKSMIFTVALSIVYIALGIKFFEKRKMENTGFSFYSTNIHLIIKALTLYPMLWLLEEVHNEFSVLEIVLIVFLMLVYYLVYDLITNKKIKFKTSLLSFAISCIVLYGIVIGFNKIDDIICKNKNISREISITDIKDVNINLVERFGYRKFESTRVDNKEIIKLMFDNIIIQNDYDYEWYNTTNLRKIKISFKKDDNKTYLIDAYFLPDKYNEILNALVNDENYIKEMVKNYNFNDGFVRYSYSCFSENINLKQYPELLDVINKNSEKYIVNTISKEIKNAYSMDDDYFNVYKYENHEKHVFEMDIENSLEIKKEILKTVNMISLDNIKKVNKEDISFINLYRNKSDEMEYYIENGSLTDKVSEKLYNFVLEQDTLEFDPQKPYYIIKFYDNIVFFTNNIEEIEKINEIDFNNDFYSDEEVNNIEYIDDVVQ